MLFYILIITIRISVVHYASMAISFDSREHVHYVTYRILTININWHLDIMEWYIGGVWINVFPLYVKRNLKSLTGLRGHTYRDMKNLLFFTIDGRCISRLVFWLRNNDTGQNLRLLIFKNEFNVIIDMRHGWCGQKCFIVSKIILQWSEAKAYIFPLSEVKT